MLNLPHRTSYKFFIAFALLPFFFPRYFSLLRMPFWISPSAKRMHHESLSSTLLFTHHSLLPRATPSHYHSWSVVHHTTEVVKKLYQAFCFVIHCLKINILWYLWAEVLKKNRCITDLSCKFLAPSDQKHPWNILQGWAKANIWRMVLIWIS